ncbi:MAG: hypothetical protein B1H13_07410 [Desulfobacteraceae bacterium 4484_190.3]|nr:MAG: hypothetical protein B1H13_07410 [Desulfobacteraceae bacterium 4484_190.3]
MKTLIVCGSRYGSTRIIAQWIAERLGFDCLITDVKDAPDPGKFELVALGSGIYENGFLPPRLYLVCRYQDIVLISLQGVSITLSLR